jgi:hypothetical protein
MKRGRGRPKKGDNTPRQELPRNNRVKKQLAQLA